MDPAQNQNQPISPSSEESHPNVPPPPSIPSNPTPPTSPNIPQSESTAQSPSSPITNNTSIRQPADLGTSPQPVYPEPAEGQPTTNNTSTSPSASPPPTPPPPPPIPLTTPSTQTFISSPQNMVPPSAPFVVEKELPVNSSVTSGQNKKFPFMIVTLILIIATAGFSLSFYFFRNANTSSPGLTSPKITPTVTLPVRVRITPSVVAGTSFFATPSASPSILPTVTTEATAGAATENQPYQTTPTPSPVALPSPE